MIPAAREEATDLLETERKIAILGSADLADNVGGLRPWNNFWVGREVPLYPHFSLDVSVCVYLGLLRASGDADGNPRRAITQAGLDVLNEARGS